MKAVGITEIADCEHRNSFYCNKTTVAQCPEVCSRKAFFDTYCGPDDTDIDAVSTEEVS